MELVAAAKAADKASWVILGELLLRGLLKGSPALGFDDGQVVRLGPGLFGEA